MKFSFDKQVTKIFQFFNGFFYCALIISLELYVFIHNYLA